MTKIDSWLLAELLKEKYDVGISEALDPCMFGIFERLGIKAKIISSALNLLEGVAKIMGIPLPASYVPLLVSAPITITKNNYWERVYNFYGHLTQYDHPQEMLPSADIILKSHFGQDFPSLHQILSKSSFVFLNMPEYLDVPRPISTKIVYIGGITINEPNPFDQTTLQIFNKSQKGVVLFSFGSIADTDKMPKSVRDAYLEAFGEFPEFEFIWKYNLREEDEELFSNFSNIHTMKWLDQTGILGVPIVATPLFGDQNYNAHAALQKETGVYVDFQKITPEVIKEALRKVLYDKKYYKNAQKLKKRLQTQPFKPHEKFVKYVEFAAENQLEDEYNLAQAKMIHQTSSVLIDRFIENQKIIGLVETFSDRREKNEHDFENLFTERCWNEKLSWPGFKTKILRNKELFSESSIKQRIDLQGWGHLENFIDSVLKNVVYDAKEEEIRIIEVGSWKGRSTWKIGESCKKMASKIHKSCAIIAIDTWLGSPEHYEAFLPTMKKNIFIDDLFYTFLNNMKSKNLSDIIHPLRLPSSAAAHVLHCFKIDAHMIFIDADHDYRQVLRDIQLFYPSVKKNGVLMGHDYNLVFGGVRQAVNEYRGYKGHKVQFWTQDGYWFMKKFEDATFHGS